MPELRFFERLAKPAPLHGRSLRGSSDREVLDSVVRHLRKILNVRQGSVMIAEDYGGGDVAYLPSHFSSPETREYERTLVRMIEKYEPRLSNVKVRFKNEEAEDSKGTTPELIFEVSARLGPAAFSFSSSIDVRTGQLNEDE